MSKKVVIAAGVLAVVALGAGAGFYFIGKEEVGAAEPEPESLGVIALEPFLTNVGDAGGKRHARVEIKLTVSPQERAEEVSADPLAIARLRDQVLSSLASKSVAELMTPEGKAELRREIVESAAPIVKPGAVKEALFGEFIVQ